MYLTRFRINTARTGSRRLLSSPQPLHAAVMSAFPTLLPTASEQPPGVSGPRVLWRLDQNARAEVFLYVVSPERPDLTHLVEQAGWPSLAGDPSTPGWETRPYTPLLERLAKGGAWAFRLTANPVHYVRNKDGAPTKRTAHTTAVHQKGWLLKQQERAGFRILEKPDTSRLLPAGTTYQGHPHHGDRYELTVRDQRDLSFAKPREERGNKRTAVTLVTATFDGRLEVTDPELLRHTLTSGLGKAKAYGCGLLTLAPIAPAPAR
ncbi:type I-E CRISPR-associated protein Cas6/Cse3/CasE [Streptomyces sp. CA-294286]|uniref:type I-E CRISPR-associated protein Cas6/Cse3/CasE n=1 Tax=Streptomyces sp. CA-294286 TaxID=3240070 RepID=UPI003D8AF856